MKITHIKHSCFSVELEKTVLLFDYFDGPLPEFDPQKDIYVFSSHVHPDHFGFSVFDRMDVYGNVHYILSRDIHKKFNEKFFHKMGVSTETYEKILFVKANETYEVGSLKVETLLSTDIGVAYVVEAEDKSIYHAGDLNWWSWPGESRDEAGRRETQFKKQIAKIQGRHFDVAFHPLDSRQEENFYKGLDWFMTSTDTDMICPMHYWEDATVIDKLKAMDCANAYHEKIEYVKELEVLPYGSH